MREQRVGLHDLRSKLIEYIRAVEAGATTIVVTDHGRHVARIVPETDSLDQRLAMLKHTGCTSLERAAAGYRETGRASARRDQHQ